MSVYDKNNKFVSYLIILITFFILVLITKNEILSLSGNIDLRETSLIEFESKKNKLEEINLKKANLINLPESIDKYDIKIEEEELIDYLFSYIEETNRKNGVVIVKNISISDSHDTEIGFKETTIDLNLLVPSEAKLKKILDFLTSSKSKYNFFIESFSYPYGKIEGNMNVTIPLKVLYK